MSSLSKRQFALYFLLFFFLIIYCMSMLHFGRNLLAYALHLYQQSFSFFKKLINLTLILNSHLLFKLKIVEFILKW